MNLEFPGLSLQLWKTMGNLVMLCRNVSKMLFSYLKFLVCMFITDYYVGLNELMYWNHLVLFDVCEFSKNVNFCLLIVHILFYLHGFSEYPFLEI